MPYPPQSFATTTNIAIDVTAVDLSTLQVSSLISSVAATANAAAASTDTVVVEVVQTSTVAMPLPAGKTAAEVASAMTTTMCAGQAGCYVVVASRRRRQLQTGSGIFTVSRRLDSSTTGTLSAPTVPTAALATALGVSSVAPPSVVSVVGVDVEVVVTTPGAASSAAATQTAQAQIVALTPTALAGAIGVSASALISTTKTLTPPPPPLIFPPPPSPPPSPSPPSPSPPPPPSGGTGGGESGGESGGGGGGGGGMGMAIAGAAAGIVIFGLVLVVVFLLKRRTGVKTTPIAQVQEQELGSLARQPSAVPMGTPVMGMPVDGGYGAVASSSSSTYIDARGVLQQYQQPPQQQYQQPPPQPNYSPAALGTEAIEKLKQLAEMKQAGILTEEEFAQQKALVLGEGRREPSGKFIGA